MAPGHKNYVPIRVFYCTCECIDGGGESFINVSMVKEGINGRTIRQNHTAKRRRRKHRLRDVIIWNSEFFLLIYFFIKYYFCAYT